MLKNLKQWRADCSETQLAAFDHKLQMHCGSAAISQDNLKKHYQSSYHCALINSKVMHEAVKTHDYIQGSSLWGSDSDAGKEFCVDLADFDGSMALKDADEQYAKSIPRLLERGVIFECDGHYHLPAEVVVEFRSKADDCSWLTLAAKSSLLMLHQLVPQSAQADMLKPKPIRNELSAWLALNGEKARQSNVIEQLEQLDWGLLLALQHHSISQFETLHQYCPEFEPVYWASYNYYSSRDPVNLRKSLEAAIPQRLCKLARLGLIGIVVQNGHENYASVTLCDEAKKLLKPQMKRVRQHLAEQIQQKWKMESCEADQPSAWLKDQQLWRLWVALHFLPAGMTQQGNLRKNELKRLSKLLDISDVSLTEFLLISMLRGGFIEQQQTQLVSVPVNWNSFGKKLRKGTFGILCQGRRDWGKSDEKQVFDLLAQLPTESWLNLNDVVSWLDLQASGNVMHASWMELFTNYQTYALHHVNSTLGRICFLPQFQAVVKQQPVTFPAPGWHGADKKSRVHGFISASGEIQLPPDCNHSILNKLAEFCSITSVEQMITLQLDQKALQRMGTDKASLKKTRTVLESLQKPLPQPVAYIFDKQQAQKPVAAVAATSMAVLLNDTSALHKLSKTGFEFSQPFKNHPELVLLDASADAHAFLKTCAEAGILLDARIKPVQWISGTASVKAWMEVEFDRDDQWLEIAYQKTRSSKPKQVIARIENDYYDAIRIQAARKTKSGFAMLKSTVTLEPKHVLRLRELDDAEIGEMNLDLLA
ncbi:MAG: hypothetical protein Q9M82_02565 [Mariprofundus sp.]|nr:hypothetical protein [Mariprofundus sp.]